MLKDFRLTRLSPARLTANWILWLRPFLVVAVLLVTVLVAYLLPSFPRLARLLQFLLLGTTAVLVLFRWPRLGLVALILASFFSPIKIPTGTNTTLNSTVLLLPLLLGFWLVDVVVRRRGGDLAFSRPTLPLLGLLVAALLAFVTGQLRWFIAEPAPLAAQLAGVAVFFLSAGAFLLVAYRVQDEGELQMVMWLFVMVGSLVILRQAPVAGPLVRSLFQQGSVGSMFWTWLIALAFGQAIGNQRLPALWRVVLVGMVLAAFYSTMQIRAWSSGWLPPLVAVGTILLIARPRLGLLALAVGGVLLLAKIDQITGAVLVQDNSYSAATRTEAWAIVLEMVKVSPVLGLGPSNYYWYTPLFPIRGWAVQFNSHSQYVDLIAQVGLLGLGFYLWFMWEVGRLGWQLRSRVPAGGFARAYLYSVLGGLAGTLVAGILVDWVLPFIYNIGLQGFRSSVFAWLFLGGVVVLERFYPAHQEMEA